MKGTPDRSFSTLVIVTVCAVALFGLVALGAEPAALPGVAAVITAVGLAVKRIQ